MTTRTTRCGALLLAWLVTLLGCTGAVLAGGAGVAQAADDGLLRVAHLSPDTPTVDLVVDPVSGDGTGLVVADVSYGTVSRYQRIPPAAYTVSLRPTGADPGSPAVLSLTVDLAPGDAITVAGLGRFADLGLTALTDELSPPAPGEARARVINAASVADPADVLLADGTVLAGGLAFAEQSGYSSVPGGPATLLVGGAAGLGAGAVDLPVDLAAGSISTVVLLDGPTGVRVVTVLDAAAPAVVPTGGVEAGAGGTADVIETGRAGNSPGLGHPVPLGVGGFAVVVLSALLVLSVRRLPTSASRR